MRLFLAIELPEDIRKHLADVQRSLAPIRPEPAMTARPNLHLTLKFLGEVEDNRVAEICESMSLVTAPRVELFAEWVECFPQRGPIRIVAASMGGSVTALRGLQHSIEQRCQFLGFAREYREYRPHVTLARARRPLAPQARDQIEKLSSRLWPGPTFPVNQFVLMESRLLPHGAQYIRVTSFRVRE